MKIYIPKIGAAINTITRRALDHHDQIELIDSREEADYIFSLSTSAPKFISDFQKSYDY